MRRSTTLAVDTTTQPNDLAYELEISPRSSVFSELKPSPSYTTVHTPPADTSSTPPAEPQQCTPSIRLLFSLISRRHLLILVIPAIISSIVAGGIAPFMTFVIGQAFDAFANFPLIANPSQSAKDQLLRSVGIAALELVGLAVGSLALSSLTSSLWIWTGENNVMALRKRVYTSVTQKDMVWFDTKMGAEGNVQSSEGPLGAGGLMAKFTRETDDVRMASSLASGMLLQYLTTCITCLVLAFLRSWALTLVILSAVPVLMIIQGFSQGVAGPLLALERSQTATAATLVDRAISAIATVKAFNAAPYEQSSLGLVLDSLSAATKRLNAVWGLTSSLAQFVMMGMFVQGFWFGSKLVKEGKVSAGDVMAVFWACLIATSNLQMCIPQFITLAKGKFAMVSLLTLVDQDTPPTPFTPVSPSAQSMYSRKSRARSTILRKIVPTKCTGELALHDVSFAYPSRPTLPVLQDVSLYLPANETTFIVGSSGSGKSTVAQLLLRMYKPSAGSVCLDDQDVQFLNEVWMRENVAGVEQGCVMFDMSVHDNVAMGLAGSAGERRPEDVRRDEVIDACRAALMHDFVRDLPDGYDTMLGNGGMGLSGGQRQRLAIARAYLRNPTVLILDEATSALDATSRILVFEAIKRWRANKTTIVITHDLSQISPPDFVYVLREGRVVEQGYRYDLETTDGGEFRDMMETQSETGGYLPEKHVVDGQEGGSVEAMLEEGEKEKEEFGASVEDLTHPFNLNLKHQSMARPGLRPLTLGNWMFDVVADLTSKTVAPASAVVAAREPERISRFVPTTADLDLEAQHQRPRRPSSIHVVDLPSPSAAYTVASRRLSLQFTPTSPGFPFNQTASMATLIMEDDDEFDAEKKAMQKSGTQATSSRRARQQKRADAPRARWDDAKVPHMSIKVAPSPTPEQPAEEERPQAFWDLVREIYPTIPYKPLVFFGVFICLCSGAMTPIFSFLLSRLLFEVSIGAQDTSTINKFGGIVLGVAAIDGILMGLKYFIMETSAMAWITRIRKSTFARVLAQDKKWFDKSDNSAVRLVQVLIKDGDDARNLIAVVLGQCAVVVAMLGVGLVWALVRGWQLTLVGFAIAPVFAATMAVQTNLVAKCELRNKRAREDVAKGYYEAISNIRGIRSMAFESVFQRQFDKAADKALSTGVRGAFVEGCTYGVASGLIYLAEALLFYVGAVLIARGTYTYLQMVEVLNLVVFTVTIGSQLMAFTQKIAKSVQATSDFNKLLRLSTDTDESRGILRPTLAGPVTFSNVQFSYPERPEAPVLKNVNMEIAEGECVAIVGSSGSGKSTIAALLQRLYEPGSGTVAVGPNELRDTDVQHLRHHVSVVSQNPNLFDATIAENIKYGNKAISEVDVRTAAKAANVHEFIMSLPQGYDTMVGENASLISGGQAQRLQIARALARPSKILILDECTSALDPSNQAAVLETIRHAKLGRTTVMVTHKLAVMRMCDRILVVHDGEIAEHGTYEQLMSRKGVFAALANGGEWVSE